MSLLRWLPTFLAFPLGGFLSLLIFGSSASPLTALGGGVIVGAAIGGAQWLALGRVLAVLIADRYPSRLRRAADDSDRCARDHDSA